MAVITRSRRWDRAQTWSGCSERISQPLERLGAEKQERVAVNDGGLAVDGRDRDLRPADRPAQGLPLRRPAYAEVVADRRKDICRARELIRRSTSALTRRLDEQRNRRDLGEVRKRHESA